MNKIKLVMMACLLGMAINSFAQFTNAKASSTGNDNAEAWQGIRVSYHPLSFCPDSGDSMGATAFSIGYVKAFEVSQSAPLFIETGANVMWTNKDLGDEYGINDDDISLKMNIFSANVPVNFGYKYQVNDKIALFPYVGMNFRINAIGTMKVEAYGESESLNLFDKKEMADWEMGKPWKRFQAGWQIGVALHANSFSVSASYGKDFTEISEKVKIAIPSITLGFNF